MKRFISVLLVTVVIASNLGAAAEPVNKSAAIAVTSAVPQDRRIPDTLMFSIDELNEIQSRATAQKNDEQQGQDADAAENATLYLSTILYYGPGDWTAWINGVPIGPKEEFQAFKVTDIGPNFVELVVPFSADGMRPVRIAPNQTFIARTGTTVEGQWR